MDTSECLYAGSCGDDEGIVLFGKIEDHLQLHANPTNEFVADFLDCVMI